MEIQNKIKPHYVDFNTAKLLPQDIFKTTKCYDENGNPFTVSLTIRKFKDKTYYSMPEQWQVVEYLRINHGIWITIDIINNLFKYKILKCEGIVSQTFGNEIKCSSFDYNSPQAAYSAAFDYILNNLI